jgi:hypothetical protein
MRISRHDGIAFHDKAAGHFTTRRQGISRHDGIAFHGMTASRFTA